jgi:UPF0755 protein
MSTTDGFRFFLKSALAVSVVFVLLVFSGLYLIFRGGGGAPIDLVIPRGSSLVSVAELLHRNGVIEKAHAFRLLMRFTGGQHRVRAGEFHFKKDMGLIDALYVVYNGEPIVHPVTVPEGWTVRQIAGILAQAGLVDEQKFLSLTLTPQAAAKYHLKAPSLEGFLFPDTYTFSKVDGEERIVDRMVQRFNSKFDKTMQEQAAAQHMTVEQVVTLASIIEKETGAATPQERTLISSVYHNRLARHMRLQADPTTIYGIPNFNGNLTRRDLETPTAYNTYTFVGLPPGPIATPRNNTLVAALNPAKTNYLYFVSNNQGSSIFSETYGQHARHVNTWQVEYFKKNKPGQIGKVDKK